LACHIGLESVDDFLELLDHFRAHDVDRRVVDRASDPLTSRLHCPHPWPGNGSEITLACDMSFASREKAIISQWEVGVGMVAGGGPMARLPELIGRNRALEVLLSSEDIRADQAEAYGYINRALPDADLDAFVEALATRIAKFDKWAIANTKRLVNTSLPPDVELGAGWDACIASLGRPAAQEGSKALIALGFHKPGDVENRLGYYLGQIAR
jgi:enoyl-CoA hydratase/carnithine racemase